MSDLVTEGEAARLLGLTRMALVLRRRQGSGPPVAAENPIRYRRGEIERFGERRLKELSPARLAAQAAMRRFP